MKSRRITEITLEKDEIFTIRQSAGSMRAHCPECGSPSVMVTPQQAAALFGIGIRDLCREVEAGRLHFLESASGSLLICLHSLQASALLNPANSTLQINPSPKDQSQTNPAPHKES